MCTTNEHRTTLGDSELVIGLTPHWNGDMLSVAVTVATTEGDMLSYEALWPATQIEAVLPFP